MQWAAILEDAIVGATITALIDKGFRLEMSDQDDGGLHIYACEEDEEVPADGYSFWVKLRPGNGADIIFDYTTNLEEILKEPLALARQFSE